MCAKWAVRNRTVFPTLLRLAAPGWGQSDAGYEAYKRGDYTAAHCIWKPLAEQGDASTPYNLGLLYHHGLGVKRQLSEAAKWYGRSNLRTAYRRVERDILA